MFIRPAWTMRGIIRQRPTVLPFIVLPLIFVTLPMAFISLLTVKILQDLDGGEMPLAGYIVLGFIFAVILTLIAVICLAFLVACLWMVGRAVGGNRTYRELLTVFAFTPLPFGISVLVSFGTAVALARIVGSFALDIFWKLSGLLMLAAFVWSIVLLVIAVRESNDFSAIKAVFVTLMVASVPSVPFVLFFAWMLL